MNWLGVEEAHNCIDKPRRKELHKQIKRGWQIFYAHLEEHLKGRYGLRDYVAVKGMLYCVGCVGIVETKPR